MILKNKNVLAGMLFFSIASFSLYLISGFSSGAMVYSGIGPEFFPTLLTALLFILSISLFIKGLLERKSDIKIFPPLVLKRGFIFMLLLLIITSLLNKLGFFISCGIFAAIAPFILGYRKIIPVLMVSSILIGSLYVLFVMILNVYFP